MAINATAYSPKQFQFLIAEQDDWGTFNPDSGGSPDLSWVAVDVDSIGSPTFNVNQVLDVRTGSRIVQATDFFHDNKSKVMEMSVSGTATTEVLDMLLTNITSDSSAPYSIGSNAGSQTFTSATTNQTDIQIFSIAYNSPSSGNTLAFKDCFCTSLTLNADQGTEGGRIKFSATFKTGSLPEELTDGQLTADTTISANNYFMNGWVAANRQILDVANVLVNSFSLNVENDMVFAGATSTGYELATRVGEISATADFSIKYDANTDQMFKTYEAQTSGISQGAVLMNDASSITDAKFGFKFPKSVMTAISFNEGDMMMLDVSVKAVGTGIGSGTALFEIGC